MSDKKRLHAIPTNIITGFLGAGKSSAILHLLKHKPEHERWAVLVNEFGEIGIDAQLISGQSHNQSGIFIREVAGGCMCCSAGLPMSIALNQLLRESKADRLLIEPSGLGHPIEVLAVLQAPHYRDVLKIEKTLTLIDARKLQDTRYTEHASFRQQLSIADVVVGNKLDLYEPQDIEALKRDIGSFNQLDPQLIFTSQGEIDPACLPGDTQAKPTFDAKTSRLANIKPADNTDNQVPALAPDDYVQGVNEDDDYQSAGWRFGANKVFSRTRLLSFFQSLDIERLKAVFITQDGIFAYNATPGEVKELELDDCLESRIEIIAQTINPNWESQLLACLD